MTVDPARLLQMLEPTVRPGALTSAGSVQQAKPSFENRSFDDLLKEAANDSAGQGSTGSEAAGKADPLVALAGLGQVENVALREVLAQASRSVSGLGQAG